MPGREARGFTGHEPVEASLEELGALMKLALVQLMVRPDPESERGALAGATVQAVSGGADVVLAPPGTLGEPGHENFALAALGSVVVLTGDEAIDPEVHAGLAAAPPDVLVISPGAESDLQVEAVVELALALSLSVAGLVIVSERSGAEPGVPGHGGSVVIVLGQVLAEALADDDILYAEVPVPVPAPVPRAPLPVVPPILMQRLAHHRGERLVVDYPADLS